MAQLAGNAVDAIAITQLTAPRAILKAMKKRKPTPMFDEVDK